MRTLIIGAPQKSPGNLPRDLTRHGVECEVAPDLGTAWEVLHRDQAFDVLLLDVASEPQGWALLHSLRAESCQPPIVLLVDGHSAKERCKGLRLGADDCVDLPCDTEELSERLRAVVRRSHTAPMHQVRDLAVDVGRRLVERGGRAIDLSPREFDVLRVLLMAEGGVVSRQSLLRDVWGMASDPGTTMVEVQIARLRKKIDRHHRALIHTVPGQGYQLS